jgi:preprotein translocase subunit SecE
MPTEEDVKPKADDPEGAPPETLEDEARPTDVVAKDQQALVEAEEGETRDEAAGDEEVLVPTQLGSQRFVFAAYFAGGIAIAFLLSKALGFAWLRLAVYKPTLGEPHDEVVMPVAAIVGALTAVYYYRDQKTRTLAEEVASELGKVSWPSRDEVVNGTFVVIVTTLLATTFFALMDRFWGFVTNLVYGA